MEEQTGRIRREEEVSPRAYMALPDDIGSISGNHVQDLFLTLNAILVSAKVLHYQADTRATHKAADRLFKSLLPLVDQYLEVYQGMHGRMNLLHEKSSLMYMPVLKPFEETREQFICTVIRTLNKLPAKCPALANLRDDMLSVAYQVKYLLQLV